MSTDISKLCADYLRDTYSSSQAKLKATHARELVAAFFGYKSHKGLLSEQEFPLDNLEECSILVPAVPLIDARSSKLTGLPGDLPKGLDLAKQLSTFLSDEGYTGADIWLYDTLETYIQEVFLIDNDSLVSDELSGAMAETNASFPDLPYYDQTEVVDHGDSLEIIASGTIKGEQLDDKPYCGDVIEVRARILLPRAAGKRGFLDYQLETGGGVNDDWRDEEMRYEVPNIRPKDQFIEMTGGFRLGESKEAFQNRQTEIHAIRNRLASGLAFPEDSDRLYQLLNG